MNELPVDSIVPQLRAALATRHAAVLQAPPGAGKTTHIPLALLNESWLQGRSILILEPRRLAARAAAARMAQLRGEKIGETVGYRIRFESRVSKKTRIEVLTEGILTRRLQTDQALEGVGLVIFDEFHERHLHADLALALCVDSQRVLRPDLKILVMSATLDGAAIAKLLNDAPLVTSEGRLFPVDVQYLTRDPSGPLPPVVQGKVLEALERREGDVLVFLPGAREIRETQHLLEETLPGGDVSVFPLYGDLPWEAQVRAIGPSAGTNRRVVLATPIAETSLTIEGVRVVIDAGYARAPRFDPATALTRLTIQRVSRASSEQRCGRAGRMAPGVCYRLWGETTQRGLIPQSVPEIRSADLAPLVLELALWGAHDAASLSWLDPPPEAALAQAHTLLTELEALDVEGRITEAGRDMARLPLHPRLAHMLRAAKELDRTAPACDIAALLSERDILAGEARRSCDLTDRLIALKAFREDGKQGAREHGADPIACQRVDQAARQWRRLIGVGEREVSVDEETAGTLLILAYPDRVAQQRGPNDNRYLLANGRGARLPEGEIHLRQPYLVAASLDAGEGEGRIYLAATVSVDTIRKQLRHRLQAKDGVHWDAQQQAVVAQHEEGLGALILNRARLNNPDPEKLRVAMIDGIRRMGIESLPWTPPARQWQVRVLSLRHWFPEENWPDVSDEALLASLGDLLGPSLEGITRRDQLRQIDVLSALQTRLDWNQNKRLQAGAPTHITVPSGSRVKLEYKPGEPPVLAVKLQEMFGLTDTPRVAWGKIPVTLHLLSPARRPIQVTQDLRGFWERTYPEVKKELKGRYPKHPWPEDPWKAIPTARTRKR